MPVDRDSLSDRLCSDGRRFTIRWTYEGYKVSTPYLNEAEVVVAAEYDAAQAEVARLRAAALAVIEDWDQNPEYEPVSGAGLRAVLNGGQDENA